MNGLRIACVIVFLTASLCGAMSADKGFQWQWRRMEYLEKSPTQSIRQMAQLKLTARERASIVDASLSAMGNSPMYQYARDEEIKEYVERADCSFEDLDGDGVPELIMEGQGSEECAGVGNCALRVFRKQGGEYKLVLSSVAQTLMVDRSAHKPLLVLYTHNSATAGDLTTYSLPRSASARKVMECGVFWNNSPFIGENTPGRPSGAPILQQCRYFTTR
ncbi:MAG TPA: hypothetical protein VIX90_01135 [Edaphobacter sp.]